MKNFKIVKIILILGIWQTLPFAKNIVSAQTLQAIVADSLTRLPIRDVNVYLSNTLWGTTTNDAGQFSITVKQVINTPLVISHIAYEQVLIEQPFKGLPDTIYLNLSTIEPVEVSTGDPYSREQKMAYFKKQFLGIDQGGRSCKILNENDINIWYIPQSNTLKASCKKPVIIDNPYLGYEVHFELAVFRIEFDRPDLIVGKEEVAKDMELLNINRMQILGNAWFIDKNTNERKIEQRRSRQYARSAPCFFRNLTQNTLKGTNFTIWLGSHPNPINPDRLFVISDTVSMKKVTLIPDMMLKSKTNPNAIGLISVLHYRTEQTDITFECKSFLVDSYGLTNASTQILYNGDFAKQRIGSFVPVDYLPASQQIKYFYKTF